MTFILPVPVDGEPTFLVLGQCQCGWWAACHEGASWPECPACGEQVLPPSALEHGDQRRAFLGSLGPEREVVEHHRVLTS